MLYPIEDYFKNMSVYLEKISKNLDSKTIKAYRLDLFGFYYWLIDNETVHIDSNAINDYVKSLQAKGLKNNTIRRKIVSLQCFFNHFYNDTTIFKDINVKSEKTLPKTLAIQDVTKMLNLLNEGIYNTKSNFHKKICVRDSAIIELLFCTGIKISELSNIRLKDIDIDCKTILIRGKGHRERYLLISSEQVLDKIKLWILYRSDFDVNCDYLFVNKYGNQLSVYGIGNVFNKYRDLSGIDEEATPDSLRHTFAKYLLENGADIRDVQESLGHSSVASTEIYTKVSGTRKKQQPLSNFNARNLIEI